MPAPPDRAACWVGQTFLSAGQAGRQVGFGPRPPATLNWEAIVHRRFMFLAAVAVVGCLDGAALAAEPSRMVVLDAASLWRCRFIKGTELVRRASGALEHTIEFPTWTWVKIDGKRARRLLKAPKMRRRPTPPPDTWMQIDFDDGDWGVSRGPFSGSGSRAHRFTKLCPRTRLIFMRGRFRVADPKKAGDLTLSLRFEGGAVVYLNGAEITRSHLPTGKIAARTPAQDYPLDAYVDPKGMVLAESDGARAAGRFAKRIRSVAGGRIPASKLRKGVNVLAVELHCAPGAEVMYTGPLGKGGYKGLLWPRVGLEELKLTAAAGAAIEPNAIRPTPPTKIRVWNHPVVQSLLPSDYGDPFAPLRPVKIVGARNGVFSGQVVLSSGKPIRNIAVEVADLRGDGDARIVASAVTIAYALPDGSAPRRYGPKWFDTLASPPSAEVAVYKTVSRRTGVRTYAAVQPVWITVRVPAEAAPGDYKGVITIRAEGLGPVRVPVELSVAGWRIPPPKQFGTFMGFIQSPDSLAVQYKVTAWSDEHWKLIERSFDLIGQVSGAALYIPAVAKTHFGNAHSMVRWVKKADRSFKHDFSIAEKYIAVAAKRLGRIQVACIYAWEPQKVGGHYEHNTFHGDREILFSVLDPKTKKLTVTKGPKWGTAECRAFWKPVMAGLKTILKKHGLDGAMMLGLCNDYEPSKGAAGDLAVAAPGVPWVVHSHTAGWLGRGIQGQRVGYVSNVWGMSGASDPDVPYVHSKQARFYGWQHPVLLTRFGRNDFRQSSPMSFYRVYPEGWVVARGKYRGGGAKGFCGTDGVGRMGADFWPVRKSRSGRVSASLAGYYNPWGGLDLNSFGVTYVLGPGKVGPVRTVRFEMLRECLQENEARFFLERILTDPKRRATLDDELARRAQDILDERVRAFLDFDIEYKGIRDSRWFVSSDWQGRSARLYAVAAEAAARQPSPKGK
jgi:glycosyl hydrolase family 123